MNLKHLSKLRYTTTNARGNQDHGFNFYQRLFVTTLGARAADVKQELRKYTFEVDEEIVGKKVQEVKRKSRKKKPNLGLTKLFKRLPTRLRK